MDGMRLALITMEFKTDISQEVPDENVVFGMYLSRIEEEALIRDMSRSLSRIQSFRDKEMKREVERDIQREAVRERPEQDN